MSYPPGILARGPWPPNRVSSRWSATRYEPSPEKVAEADRAIDELRGRGSPSHDGVSARLERYTVSDEGDLVLELQEMRWALRLLRETRRTPSRSCAWCATTRVAGSRAGGRSGWRRGPACGRSGAGGAVDAGEDPTETLARELLEEWSVEPERLDVEALIAVPSGMAMLIGQAWLAPGAEVQRDHEHDDHAWWPPDPANWPEHAHPQLQRLATLLS